MTKAPGNRRDPLALQAFTPRWQIPQSRRPRCRNLPDLISSQLTEHWHLCRSMCWWTSRRGEWRSSGEPRRTNGCFTNIFPGTSIARSNPWTHRSHSTSSSMTSFQTLPQAMVRNARMAP